MRAFMPALFAALPAICAKLGSEMVGSDFAAPISISRLGWLAIPPITFSARLIGRVTSAPILLQRDTQEIETILNGGPLTEAARIEQSL